ncbi:MAG: winged helix-turn-helix domain-containing protein [Clostridia bacterium]
MIYYVEDDGNIRELLVYALKQTGYEAAGFADAVGFFEALKGTLPELVLLDLMLPGTDGLSIIRSLKGDARTAEIPVMMITAKGAEGERVLGLDAGADDYVTKPFGVMELIARIKAVLRRSGAQRDAAALQMGEVALDDGHHTVRVAGRQVALTLKEYELLRFLMVHPNAAFDREQLLSAVWEQDYFGGSRTVDVHVQTLRQKLGAAGEQIETIRGLGYRFRGTVK